MTAFILILLLTGTTVGEYENQEDCLHAMAFLPNTTEAACIPAPNKD